MSKTTLDEILDKYAQAYYEAKYESRLSTCEWASDEAKQAITSLIKELVAEAKPNDFSNAAMTTDETNWYGAGYNHALEKFEQSLLKALEVKYE